MRMALVALVLAGWSGCGDDTTSGSLDLSMGDFAGTSQDLASTDLACVNDNCTGNCCGGLQCDAKGVCVASCGQTGAPCTQGGSEDCCYGFYCNPAGPSTCVACVGAGRQPGGEGCPNGNADCCGGVCVGGTCEF
jgi:hypothetical protein